MSKRIRFIVRVKSSCSSLERASEQLSRLEGGGGERGENEKRRGRRRKERERREEGRRKAEDGGERKEPISITFLLDNVIVWPAMCHAPSIPPSPPISSTWALPCFLQSWRGSSSSEHSLQLLLPQLPHPLHWHTVHVEVVTQQCLRLLPAMYTVDTIHQWTVKERPHTSANTLGKAFMFQRRAHLSHLTSHTSFLHPW